MVVLAHCFSFFSLPFKNADKIFACDKMTVKYRFVDLFLALMFVFHDLVSCHGDNTLKQNIFFRFCFLSLSVKHAQTFLYVRFQQWIKVTHYNCNYVLEIYVIMCEIKMYKTCKNHIVTQRS